MQFHESNIFQPFCRSWAKVYTALHTFYPAARTGDVPNGLGVACSQQHSTTARLLLKCTPEKLGKTAVERTQVGYVSSQNRLAHRLIAVESLTQRTARELPIYLRYLYAFPTKVPTCYDHTSSQSQRPCFTVSQLRICM